MARTLATLLLGLALAAAPGCGRKGPLQLPQGRAPMPVEALTAAAADGSVLLRWTNPVKAVSGKPVESLDAVEVWVFDQGLPAAGQGLTSGEIEKTARLVRRLTRPEIESAVAAAGAGPAVMTFSYVLPASSPAKLAFTVRVVDRKGRASDFAAPAGVDTARKDAGVARPAPEVVS
jgi:predicted small lipoprotein YifL